MNKKKLDTFKADDTEASPVFKNWSGWYWLVIIITSIQFLIYFFISRSFS